MITFKVDDVEITTEPDLWYDNQEHFLKQGMACVGLRGGTTEAYKFNADRVDFQDARTNSFVHTLMASYDRHVPLALAPDDVWLVVAQAVTKHIELNPEECRRALVSWDGKKKLQVRRDGFRKGSPDNDWEGAFAEFGDQIQEAIGNKRDLFDPTFTTTTPTEKAAIQVQMMSALAPYFEYRMMTCCGFPQVTLLGEPQDWFEIAKRVDAFGEFYPKWAYKPLVTAVSHFVRAAAGKPDMGFWQNLFKRSGGSGGTYINGWVNAFFPYVNGKPNKMMLADFETELTKGPHAGHDVGDYGGTVATVPMEWDYFGTKYDMGLVTGIFGTTILEVDGAKAYKPVVGWAVGEAKAK